MGSASIEIGFHFPPQVPSLTNSLSQSVGVESVGCLALVTGDDKGSSNHDPSTTIIAL